MYNFFASTLVSYILVSQSSFTWFCPASQGFTQFHMVLQGFSKVLHGFVKKEAPSASTGMGSHTRATKIVQRCLHQDGTKLSFHNRLRRNVLAAPSTQWPQHEITQIITQHPRTHTLWHDYIHSGNTACNHSHFLQSRIFCSLACNQQDNTTYTVSTLFTFIGNFFLLHSPSRLLWSLTFFTVTYLLFSGLQSTRQYNVYSKYFIYFHRKFLLTSFTFKSVMITHLLFLSLPCDHLWLCHPWGT